MGYSMSKATALLSLILGCGASASTPQPKPPPNSAPQATRAEVTETPASDDPCSYPASEEALLKCRQDQHARTEQSIQNLEQQLTKLFAGQPDLPGAFDAAEAKWREFRDAECRLRTFDSRDGTAFESYWLDCLTMLNRDRIATLQYMKENP
jgi:uncharacterized protein YecT (DUF1311 family)